MNDNHPVASNIHGNLSVVDVTTTDQKKPFLKGHIATTATLLGV